MSAVRVPSTSLQYVKVGPVRLEEDGELVDPTDSVVEMAFTATDEDPADVDYVAADWETGRGRHFARTLVGPTATVLAEGAWHVWVRITRDPERPVWRAPNQLVVT